MIRLCSIQTWGCKVAACLVLARTHLAIKSLREGDHFSGCLSVGGGSRTILVSAFNRCSP